MSIVFKEEIDEILVEANVLPSTGRGYDVEITRQMGQGWLVQVTYDVKTGETATNSDGKIVENELQFAASYLVKDQDVRRNREAVIELLTETRDRVVEASVVGGPEFQAINYEYCPACRGTGKASKPVDHRTIPPPPDTMSTATMEAIAKIVNGRYVDPLRQRAEERAATIQRGETPAPIPLPERSLEDWVAAGGDEDELRRLGGTPILEHGPNGQLVARVFAPLDMSDRFIPAD